jgi:DNA polymerase-3 subunit beta
MKLTIERAALLKALGHVQSAVERRNTIPILSNVLLSAERDRLTFSATDLDMEIIDEAVAQVDQPGQITAPAHTLYEIVRKLPEGADVSLAFTGDDPRLTVAAGRSRFNLPVLPAGDFPVMSAEGLGGGMAVDVNDLMRLMDKTRFAISTEETRYYLNGIYLHVVEDGSPVLRAAATDGHRLARVTVARPDGADSMPGVIIPRKCVGELRKLLDEVDGSIGVSLSNSKIRFDLGQAILTSKLIDGTFPDYTRVIPTANDKLLKLDPKSFMEGVDRVSTIATEKTRAVKMALERDKIILSVTSPENGAAAEEVPGDYAAPGFEIGFNSRYLMDILNQIEGDSVEVHLADAAAPTLIRENDKSPALYVLMPMRV